MGGFARRASYWKAFAARFPSHPTLRIDGGSLFSVGALESLVVNRWMLEGTWRSRLDAVGLTAWDLPAWQELADMARGGLFPREWLEVPLVSANVRPKSVSFPKLMPYVIREVAVGEKGSRKVRVGITALLHDPEERISRADFEILDPEKTALEVVEELKKQTDYRIVLTDQAMGPALSLAFKVAGINLLLVTRNYSTITDAQQVGDTLFMLPVNEGRMISEVRLTIDAAAGRAGASARLVPLEKNVPDDPAMGELAAKARAEIDKAKIPGN